MTEAESLRPVVSVGVLVLKDGKILMGKRIGKFAGGIYGLPGGHMEHMESFEECVRRETKEEAGIEITNIKFLRLLNMKAYPPKHYVEVAFVADWKSGEPQVLEPEKFENWGWYDIDNPPTPMFEGIYSHIESYKTGRTFYDG